ncbi:hypothetical protein [Nonomuraea pusilla]|uniref:Uncharacterized protein n=1 Tax=Nonomuraea pusilla TaxID=46177 RepID=A0A1H7FKS4_9ACTN|nr:hypothetical protein [Nonomuraea pusilla]SEK26696.1 hypothetical protein SAMN05660976_00125 [Nonomuraea pusilla]
MSIKDELQQVEEDLARLKAENKDIREQVRNMGATDQVEISALIALADEQGELIADLERRRDGLRARLERESSPQT